MTGLVGRSLSAAVVICILILLRRLLLHRLPKAAFRAAWAVVVLRLLIPFSVPVFSGDMPGGISRVTDFLMGGPQEADGRKQSRDVEGDLAKEKYVWSDIRGARAGSPDGWNDESGQLVRGDGLNGESGPSVRGDGLNGESGQSVPGNDWNNENKNKESAPPVQKMLKPSEITAADRQQADVRNTANINRAAGINFILRGIWLAGMFFVLFYFLFSHLRARKRYVAALPVEYPLPETAFCSGKESSVNRAGKLRRKITVKTSDRIFAPVTYGLFYPVILLPKTMDWENTVRLRMVLEHETIHIRRFDILYKWLLAAAVALHWFNPFVWAMYFLADRDIELSCDEAVIRRYEKDGKKDYALTLLNYEEKRMFLPTANGFGGNAVKERIEAIMKINKTSVVSMAMAVILVAGTTTVFAGAKENRDTPANRQEELREAGKSETGTNVHGQDLQEGNPKNGNLDGQDLQEGSRINENPDGQNEQKENENQGIQDSNGKNPSEKQGDGSSENQTPVKQYLCEPAYYTLEEFEEVMELEREEIRSMLKKGFITQEDADEMFAKIDKDIEEVRNGQKREKPSQVYYADGTPVVNSLGGYLYVKASDIEQMNAQLRAKAEGADEPETASWDTIAILFEGGDETRFMTKDGKNWEFLPDPSATNPEPSWYSYEEYKEYVERQKEEYRQMRGEWGFNSVDGWYEWDDEKIEEACRLLDENLEFIKNGGMISKPDLDGGCLMSGSSQFMFSTGEGENWNMSEEEAIKNGWEVRQAEKISPDSGEYGSGILKDYEVKFKEVK